MIRHDLLGSEAVGWLETLSRVGKKLGLRRVSLGSGLGLLRNISTL